MVPPPDITTKYRCHLLSHITHLQPASWPPVLCPRLARTRGFHLNLTTKPRLRRGWWRLVTVVTMVLSSGLQQGGFMSYALLRNLHGITTQEVLTMGATLETPAIKERRTPTINQQKKAKIKGRHVHAKRRYF